MKQRIYILYHIYDDDGIEETKFIGVFSSETNVQQVISELKEQPGFNLYPEDCFFIDESFLDHYEWKEGFVG
jgi:hypothetical protein